MTYGEWSDNFQRSFPGGSFESFATLAGKVVRFTGLKISEKSDPIPSAIVVYDQEGKTWVTVTNKTTFIRPLTESEYTTWKEEDVARKRAERISRKSNGSNRG